MSKVDELPKHSVSISRDHHVWSEETLQGMMLTESHRVVSSTLLQS